MNQTRKIFFACLFVAVGLLYSAGLYAQAPSLAPSDAFYITAKTEFGEETFTVIRDGRIEEQFYFVPARPHVAIETRNGKKTPVFELLTFQRAVKGELKQGGILQLSIQTGISQATETDLLNKIKSNFPLKDSNKKHRLSPIPMKDAQVTMYDLGGDMLSSAPVKAGVAPLFGNQQYPFMLNLTDLGADTMEALTRGKGGLPVIISYTFQGMTPAGGFKVEVNWDSCFKHFSTDTKLKAQVGYAMLTGSLGADMATIREKMISNGMIKVSSLANEALPPEKIDAVLEPVLALVTKELFEQIKPPAQIPPAMAKEIAPVDGPKSPAADTIKQAGEAIGEAASAATTAIPYVGTIMKIMDMAMKTKMDVGASFSLKDVKIVKKGKFTYTFDRQAIVERKTAFGGPIGIGAFAREIQDQCIHILPIGHWEAAHFVLPPVGDLEQFGASHMTMTVRALENKKQISGMPIQMATYNYKGDGLWRGSDGREISKLLFPLKAVFASDAFKKNPESFKFSVSSEIIGRSGKVSMTSEVQMFDGDAALSSVGEDFIPVFVSGDCLSFGKGEDEIFRVNGSLKAGKNNFRIGLSEDATSAAFLIPANEKSVKITNLVFFSKTGKKYQWSGVGKDLREISPELDIMLFDSDWQSQPDADSISGSPY